MTIDFTLNALIAYLKENDQQPQLQKETGQVYITYTIHDYEVPVFFLLRPDSGLLQIVAYLPYMIPKERLGDLARMLHILNKELDMPGFCMDESEQLIFYRAVVPCPNDKIDKYFFNMYLGTTRIVCDTFMHAIGIIISGTMSVDEVLKQQRDTRNES